MELAIYVYSIYVGYIWVKALFIRNNLTIKCTDLKGRIASETTRSVVGRQVAPDGVKLVHMKQSTSQ